MAVDGSCDVIGERCGIQLRNSVDFCDTEVKKKTGSLRRYSQTACQENYAGKQIFFTSLKVFNKKWSNPLFYVIWEEIKVVFVFMGENNLLYFGSFSSNYLLFYTTYRHD